MPSNASDTGCHTDPRYASDSPLRPPKAPSKVAEVFFDKRSDTPDIRSKIFAVSLETERKSDKTARSRSLIGLRLRFVIHQQKFSRLHGMSVSCDQKTKLLCLIAMGDESSKRLEQTKAEEYTPSWNKFLET